MDYPCGKFGDCTFSRFGSIERTDRHTHQRETEADERYTPATVVGVSNYYSFINSGKYFSDEEVKFLSLYAGQNVRQSM